MNTERFIAKRMLSAGGGSFSAPVVRIAVISVALGVAVMIVAIAIVTGFQKQVSEKITGFGSHIQIAKFNENKSFEFEPIYRDKALISGIQATKGVKHVQVFATKAGIIKTADQIQGVVLKGVGSDFDWSFFSDKLVEGKVFSTRDTIFDKVIVSKMLADKLMLKTGDPLRMYFIIENQTRARRFTISGIYSTGLSDFDQIYVFGDIRQIQKLNGWTTDSVSGIDVYINNFGDLDAMGEKIYKSAGFDLDARTIRDLYPQLFDWLRLQDMNVVIILVLMILVSGMAMISTILILILERTNMIGVLKALGSRNASIRRIFIFNAMFIIGKGMLYGNLVGIGLCLVQQYTGLIPLPQESYFMSVVPVNLQITHLLILNLGTLAVCTLMMIVPSLIVARISPVKAIRFD